MIQEFSKIKDNKTQIQEIQRSHRILAQTGKQNKTKQNITKQNHKLAHYFQMVENKIKY